jgi:hypothetical protein
MKTIALKIAGQEITTPAGIPNPTSANITLESLISGIISLMTTASVVLALFFIVYGGWLWINSAGDKDKIRHARMTIIYTLVGLAIVVTAMVAVNIVTTMLGLK